MVIAVTDVCAGVIQLMSFDLLLDNNHTFSQSITVTVNGSAEPHSYGNGLLNYAFGMCGNYSGTFSIFNIKANCLLDSLDTTNVYADAWIQIGSQPAQQQRVLISPVRTSTFYGQSYTFAAWSSTISMTVTWSITCQKYLRVNMAQYVIDNPILQQFWGEYSGGGGADACGLPQGAHRSFTRRLTQPH